MPTPNRASLSMTMTDESTIEPLEVQLRLAMLAGDVEALEALLADDMTSIDHLGRRADKSQELEAYRTEVLKLDQLDVYDSIIKPIANAASVSLRARIGGMYYGETFSAKVAYTRVWACRQGVWTVISMHYSLVTI
ncbi:nuclear transport factor 2 family protein [Phyllobacterium chamaecytisi]|uniref:nuclear transport factor 2 family protein n=1 Tax=Phyllobacterium chamaecytisi TaxID=2876082 RepID=UPI001CCFCC64|nr:nuclear transport factor 2 family protein [Phyllobacterium sp. KW56]MBZ9605488.1 nuclear transport factor 2 family protein [Phyllobacterium sp. KW56]